MIPIEGYAFLDALAIGEDYNPLDYNELVGGGKFSDYSAFPEWAGREFSTGRSHAAGRYQFEPATWRECAAACKLTDFSPESQDIAAWYLAQRVMPGLLELLQDNKLVGIATRLHSTWTSLSERTFPLRYGVALGRRHASNTQKL